jgi:hypothetical protein
MYTRSISSYSTPRKCAVCLLLCNGTVNDATLWQYQPDKRGGIDFGSRTAVCAEHENVKPKQHISGYRRFMKHMGKAIRHLKGR